MDLEAVSEVRALIQPPHQKPANILVDARQAAIDRTIELAIALLPPVSVTFAELGQIIAHSHEWVRQRLAQDPRVFKIGNKTHVPLDAAVEYIRKWIHLMVGTKTKASRCSLEACHAIGWVQVMESTQARLSGVW